jgi:2-oxoglutarate ferredoxin oxidoreductase subunit delta
VWNAKEGQPPFFCHIYGPEKLHTFHYGIKEYFQMEKTLPKIEIIEKYCKGCHICVEFCPTKVLEMQGFVAAVKNLEACIKCMQCELRCPDFAIKVITE